MIFKVSVHNARLPVPKDPQQCPPALQSLLTACWESSPERRPGAEAILSQLEAAMEEARVETAWRTAHT